MPGKPLDNACPGWIAVECRPSTLIATDDSGHPPTLTDLKGAQLRGGAAAPDPAASGLSRPLFQPLTAYAARGRIFPAPARTSSLKACPFLHDEAIHRRSSRLLLGNHSTPEPGLAHVDEDTEET